MLDLVFTDDYSMVDKNNNFKEPSQFDDTDMKISAQFGKRFDNFLVRGGLIENSGGVGIDYFMYNDKLKTSLEIFDFDSKNDIRGNNPHSKFSIRYSPIKHIDTFIGYDNFLNKKANNIFFGAGVRFIDEDMPTLIGTLGGGGFTK